MTRPAVRPIFQSVPICPRHPGTLKGSHQTAGGLPAPRGISPLAWFSRNRPHCLRRITAAGRFNARTLGWTGVSLSPLLVMAVPGAIRYWQPAVSRSLPGRTNLRPYFSFSVVSCCFLPADHRAAAAWALAFAKAAGMCLMNGYAVFKVPGEVKKDLSLYLPLSERSNNLFTQKSFQLFENLVFSLVYGLLRNTQSLCSLVFCFPGKEQGID